MRYVLYEQRNVLPIAAHGANFGLPIPAHGASESPKNTCSGENLPESGALTAISESFPLIFVFTLFDFCNKHNILCF